MNSAPLASFSNARLNCLPVMPADLADLPQGRRLPRATIFCVSTKSFGKGGPREFLAESEVGGRGYPCQASRPRGSRWSWRQPRALGDLEELRFGAVALVTKVNEGRNKVVELVAGEAKDRFQLAERGGSVLDDDVSSRARIATCLVTGARIVLDDTHGTT